MKSALQAVLQSVASMFDGPLEIAVQTAAALIGQLDLPDGDERWGKVGELVAQTIDDIRDARDLDAGAQMQVRLAAERRMHLQLRDLGLIQEG